MSHIERFDFYFLAVISRVRNQPERVSAGASVDPLRRIHLLFVIHIWYGHT